MRLVALIATVLLGASPSVYAQPEPTPGHPREGEMLVERVRLEGNGNVKVAFDGQPVRRIQLQAFRGGAHLTRATVQYSDGSRADVRIDQTLDVSSGVNLRVDLGRSGMRGVDSIVFWGRGDASFRVVGVD